MNAFHRHIRGSEIDFCVGEIPNTLYAIIHQLLCLVLCGTSGDG